MRIGADRYAHWFDGDGMMHALRVDGRRGTASYRSRFVKTDRYLLQRLRSHERIAVKGAWTPAAGGNRLTSFLRNLGMPTNPSNTSVLSFAGKLLSLCEAALPIEVDPETLETVMDARGPVSHDFGGGVPGGGFSAHYKICAETGELFNFGISPPLSAGLPGLNVYKISPEGGVTATASLPFEAGYLFFVHDFAISANHLVFFMPPWVTPLSASVGALAGGTALGHSFGWRPELGTRLVVLRRADLSVALDCKVPNFSTYHFANAFEADGKLEVLVNHLNGPRDRLEALFANMYAAKFTDEGENTLMRHTIDLGQGGGAGAGALAYEGCAPAVPFEPCGWPSPGDRALGMEFPEINPRYVGRPNRYVYSTALSDGTFLDTLQKHDLEAGTTAKRKFGPERNFGEAMFIPKEGAAAEDDGYLLLHAYRNATHTSDMVVVDARTLETLCELHLPCHVPYTFHGQFDSAGPKVAAAD